MTIIMALTAHVHQLAIVLRPALPDQLTIAHMPLVRAIFESTVTVAWCDEVADGADAILNEGARQRRNLRASLAATRSMKEFSEQIKIGVGTLPTSSTEHARKMEARCADLALDGAYAIYRMLSNLSHVSIDSLDAYLDSDSFHPNGSLSIKSNPGSVGSSFSWAHLVASCLVWSGRVADYLDPACNRRSDLRRSARKLDIQPELRVLYSAHQRGSDSRRKL